MLEQAEYRLAFILPGSRQLLAKLSCGEVTLPYISVPLIERPVAQLARFIEKRWQIRVIVLDILRGESDVPSLAIVEIRTSSSRFEREELRPMVSDIIQRILLRKEERSRLASILSGSNAERTPFSRIGWIEEAQQWIRDASGNQNLDFTDDIAQLNACGGFALVRFGTKKGLAYWLKAVGKPNQHEFQITKALGERFPNRVPRIIAMREDWNAWVMEEAGQPLCHTFTLTSVEKAIVSLGEFQKESIDHIDSLLAVGCLDRRIPVIEAHLRDMTEYLENAMSRQASTKVPRIETYRLRELEHILRSACAKIQDLCIPDTLIHSDINAGNILIGGSHCTFIDWAEAYVGNPFMTLQYLCAHVSRERGAADTWIAQMKSTYKTVCLAWLNEEKIDQALALMPILAAATYLYGRGDWIKSPRGDAPAFQAYARGLARHMDREAQSQEFLEALCR